MELHPDMLSTGQLTSHDSSSPYHFLNHTTIGSRYPEKGYDDFFVFDQTDEQVQLHHLVFPVSVRRSYSISQITRIFKETELPGFDLVHKVIKPVPGEPIEPKVILEGSQSGIKLCFTTNRKSYFHVPS